MDNFNERCYYDLVKNGGELSDVPTKYITLEMCYEYLKRTRNLDGIPKEFLIKLYAVLFCKNQDIKQIPKRVQTKQFWVVWFKLRQKIFLTQEICNTYFEHTGDIDSIPIYYRTQEMYNKYFEHTGDIYSVPLDYITQEMCDKYFEHTVDIKPIPDKYKTKEMCDEYFEKTGDVKPIPDKYKTQEMWDKYFNFYYNLHYIPEQFISFEMCQKSFERYHNLYEIPDNYRELVSEDYFVRTGNLEDIPKEYRINIAKNILTILENVMFTKTQLLKNFNWSDIQFDSIMKIISEDSSEIYLAIQNILNNNMKNYIFNTKARVEFLNDLVTSMNLKKQNELTKDQKILFTYQLFSQKPYRSLDVIWDWINRYPQKNKQLINFFRWHLKYKTAFDMSNYEVLSKKEQEMEHLPNWIKTYNLNKSMESDDRPLSLFFVHDGETIVINKDDVKNVLSTLKENDVPTKNCIVNEAIKYYSYGALDEFIENLQLSSVVNEKAENKKR